jgi:hypothetical protein
VVRTSPAFTITAGMVGQVLAVEGYVTGAVCGLRVNGVEVGAPTACVGYTASATAMFVGIRSGGILPATDTTIFGVCTYNGLATLKQSAALAADAKLLRDIPGGGTANAWSFKRAGGSAPPATLSNLSGTDDLTRAGAPAYTTVSPTFAY